MGYFGLMRVGELTESEGGHAVKFRDVNNGRNKKKIVVFLQSSKMHYLSEKPQIITVNGFELTREDETWYNLPKYCPYKIIVNYILARGGRKSSDEQFFIFRDSSPVKAEHFRAVLKRAISDAGLQPDNYETHSLRISCTKDLFKAGYSIEKIKDMGRWKSNAVYNYLK